MKIMNKYENCLLCPRKCGINRAIGQTGVCGVSAEIRVARAALHYWEEPCISGKKRKLSSIFLGLQLTLRVLPEQGDFRRKSGKGDK